MTRVYLIRHAEAEGNIYRRIHGWYDALVTDNGYRQIAALEKRFAPISIDAVYASDLYRTRATASAIWRAKGLPLITLKELREIGMGKWEDQTWGAVARLDGESLRKFNTMDSTWQVEGGEDFRQVRRRMESTLRAIAARHPGESVAVFSHGSAIRSALGAFHGLSIPQCARLGHSDNTAVSLLEFDGERVNIPFENDNSHLPAEISTLGRQSWWKNEGRTLQDDNLWYRPLDVFRRDTAFYTDARREAWQSVYGTLEGFDGAAFLEQARHSAARAPESLICAMLKEEPAGVLQLDLERDAGQGVGWISFYYMAPEARQQGLGVQLLGQAVGTYRPLGRERLRLCCNPENEVAQRFYRRYGFVQVGRMPGSHGALDVLEKYIGYRYPWE